VQLNLCSGYVFLANNAELDVGGGVLLERLRKFCYVGDTLEADRGCDLAVMTTIRSASETFFKFLI